MRSLKHLIFIKGPCAREILPHLLDDRRRMSVNCAYHRQPRIPQPAQNRGIYFRSRPLGLYSCCSLMFLQKDASLEGGCLWQSFAGIRNKRWHAHPHFTNNFRSIIPVLSKQASTKPIFHKGFQLRSFISSRSPVANASIMAARMKKFRQCNLHFSLYSTVYLS
jgi:hypothetical protein